MSPVHFFLLPLMVIDTLTTVPHEVPCSVLSSYAHMCPGVVLKLMLLTHSTIEFNRPTKTKLLSPPMIVLVSFDVDILKFHWQSRACFISWSPIQCLSVCLSWACIAPCHYFVPGHQHVIWTSMWAHKLMLLLKGHIQMQWHDSSPCPKSCAF